MIEDTSGEPGVPPVAPDAAALEPAARREALKHVFLTARDCTRCPQLAGTRTHVVFGGGHADAALMLVGEAPGAREDEGGAPFIGASGKLLDELLASAELSRRDVFITNVLKCRPPGNRDPSPRELANCRDYLDEQIALVRPRVIATLGSVATRALRGDGDTIAALHGRPELLRIGDRTVRLLPLYHPAAALYTRALLDTLRADFARIPELLALPEPNRPA